MSDQEQPQDQEHEVVPVEVYRDPADEGAPAEADEQPEAVDHGVDGGEAASDSSDPAEPVAERATANDLQAESYERAKLDPEYAAQQAIDVPEDERGPAWEAGSLAAQQALENAEDLEVNDSPPEWDDADRSEEV